MKRAVLSIVLIFAFLIGILQIDDDLDHGAELIVNQLESPNESEAYIYLLGIYANVGDDPSIEGRRLLDEYQKYLQDKNYEIEAYQESNELPAPEGALFCAIRKDGCLRTLFSEEFDIDQLLKKHKILLQRAEVFYEFHEYHTLAKLTLEEILPRYEYLSGVERIKLLTAVSTYKKGHTKKAVSLLFSQIKNLRRMLQQQDTIVGKNIFLIKISDAIDVMSVILAESGSEITMEQIPELSQDERDLSQALIREFGMGYYMYTELDRNPEFFDEGGHVPGWIIRLLYKPNMTINAIAPVYSEAIRRSKLKPSEFSSEIKNEIIYIDSTIGFTFRVRNFIGSLLLEIAGPNYDEYSARFMDLDAKLALFNQIYHFHGEIDAAENPYYEGDRAMVSGNKTCFSGPLEDELQLRCLYTRITM